MKFLYLTGSAPLAEDAEWLTNLHTAAKSRSDLKVFASSYKDLLHLYSGSNWEIIDLRNNCKLSDYDVVHFRNYSSLVNEVGTVASYLDDHQVKYINSEVKNIYNPSSKLWQMKHLHDQGLPVPPTYFFHSSNVGPALEYLQKNVPGIFPCVIKLIDGMKGSHNYLASDADSLKKIYSKHRDKKFILQPFIQNDGDYRLLFIGTEDEPYIFKRIATPGSHLNNTSKGGEAKEITIGDFEPKYISMCRQAAKSMDLEISGVDLIIDSKSNKPYILEVNTTPAILTGFNTPKKTAKYLDYLMSTQGGSK